MRPGSEVEATPKSGEELAPIHWWILGGWMAVAFGLFVRAAGTMRPTADSPAAVFQFIGSVAVVFLFVSALFAIILLGFVIRFVIEDKTMRTVVALSAPALCLVAFLLVGA